jgi:spore germination protein KB
MSGYVLGTAMILGVGAEVKQDAWIFTLMGMVSSLLFMWIFTQLSIYYPGDSLIQILPKLIGRFLSYPIILLYIFHFTYSAARGCRELGELIISTMLTETPIYVTIGSAMLLIVYCLRGGIETLARMSEVLFPIYIIALLIVWVLLLSVEQFNLHNLRPILGDGIQPILKELIPNGINFPFGETIVIMMFFPFLKKQKDIRKIGLSIILIGGTLLVINTMLMIAVLGAEQYSRDIYKLLSTTQLVSVADFLERFDILVIILMVSGVFFKVGGFTLAASIAISHVFRLRQYRSVVLGLAPIILFLSFISADSYVEHLEIGFNYFIPYLLTFLQLILPILLLCIAFIRKRIVKG